MINWKCRPSDRVIEGYLKMRADEPFKPATGITPYGLRAACLAAARAAVAAKRYLFVPRHLVEETKLSYPDATVLQFKELPK